MHVTPDAKDTKPSQKAEESGSEHRSGQRRRMLKAGKVVVSDSSMIDCTIRDISEGGARIVFAGPTRLPKGFWLMIVSEGKMIPAELLWQRGLAAGISFTGPERPAPPIIG